MRRIALQRINRAGDRVPVARHLLIPRRFPRPPLFAAPRHRRIQNPVAQGLEFQRTPARRAMRGKKL
jgi:hypothetical protein